MLTTIYSPAGNGKSYLTIRKALEASKGKRLLILTYEMSSYQILKRVNACLDHLHIEAPKKITVQEKSIGAIVPLVFENQLNELFTKYDVIALDSYFINQLLISSLSYDAIDTKYVLKKCLTDTLKHNPDKKIFVNMNTIRPAQLLSLTDSKNIVSDVKNDFFNGNLVGANEEENILIFKENADTFNVFDYNKKSHDVIDSSDFLFGMNKK